MHAREFFRPVSLVALASFAIATVTLTLEGDLPRFAKTPAAEPATRSGDEIVAVLLITETCPASSRDDFKEAVRNALVSLRESARSRGLRAFSVGVVLGPNASSSRNFIANLAKFDELVIGRGWLNSGAVEYVWRDMPGTASVPQLVILQRRVEVTSDGIQVSPDSLLLRLSDADDIVRWSKAGAPLGI